MKAVLLCNASANQRALAHRLHAVMPLSAIGVVGIAPSHRKGAFARRAASVTVGWPLRRAWRGMLDRLDGMYPAFPEGAVSNHDHVNAESVERLIRNEQPDLVLVSGTDLLKPRLISLIGETGRIMNLHTGISPYIKGAPNCTNWALSLGEPDLIGNTIMWLDAGIDSGNIIATERTPLSGRESLGEVHIKVMDHAHDLYGRCLARFRDGAPLPSVPQVEIDKGRLFLLKHWTARAMLRAVLNFYFGRGAGPVPLRSSIRLVAPDQP